MSNDTIEIEIVNTRPSRCLADVPGALDCDVLVTLGDESIEGAVTLTRSGYDRTRYAAESGSPDEWVAGALLDWIRAHAEDEREALRELEVAAATACEAYRPE